MTVGSILDDGIQAISVDVECHMTNGLPNIVIVGFASKAIDESKERIRSAFSSASLQLPRKRITINLAPADIPKDSTSFDLPIAVSILLSSGQIEKLPDPKRTAFIGELGLDGSVRSVRGIIGKLMMGSKKGFNTFFIPADNFEQAALVPDLTIVPVKHIRDLYMGLTGAASLKQQSSGRNRLESFGSTYQIDFVDVVGQARAKRALEIAAAGGHNILMSGAPGTGKSMLAKALPSILPPMTLEETLQVTHIHSLANRQYEKVINQRPFRSPHHSASTVSVVGGGQSPRPGEVSLAHHGVLMLDEFPEFGRSIIESLRQPLEDRVISVARAKSNVTFPANFMLVATCNPCPCGYYGTRKTCVCLPHHIANYNRKLSGPILDRIDLYVDVDEVKHDALLSNQSSQASQDIQTRVISARERQQLRLDGQNYNSSLSNREIKHSVKLTQQAEQLLNQAAEKMNVSPRSYMKILKVAQTIADLAESDKVDIPHIGEALQYRRQSNEILA